MKADFQSHDYYDLWEKSSQAFSLQYIPLTYEDNQWDKTHNIVQTSPRPFFGTMWSDHHGKKIIGTLQWQDFFYRKEKP